MDEENSKIYKVLNLALRFLGDKEFCWLSYKQYLYINTLIEKNGGVDVFHYLKPNKKTGRIKERCLGYVDENKNTYTTNLDCGAVRDLQQAGRTLKMIIFLETYNNYKGIELKQI